jgi:hypothetical protein
LRKGKREILNTEDKQLKLISGDLTGLRKGKREILNTEDKQLKLFSGDRKPKTK